MNNKTNLTSPRVVMDIVNKYGFSFTRSLGQNFLADSNILNKIVDSANLSKDDYVLEIGSGIGTMTIELAERSAKVVTIEIDKKLLPLLDETLAGLDNVEVINADILKVDIRKLISDNFGDAKIKVVANLPYYITTPIVMRFLEEGIPFDTMVVLVQKEVGMRMCATPGGKEYGALSVAVNYYARPSLKGKVPASVFVPKPKVDSAIVCIESRENPPVELIDKALFFKVVKAAFSKRRKTILNSLSSSELGPDKETTLIILNKSGIDSIRRAETLDMNEYARLSNEYSESIFPDRE